MVIISTGLRAHNDKLNRNANMKPPISTYREALKLISSMNMHQLKEFFYDLEDIEAVRLISKISFEFLVENWGTTKEGKSEWDEWTEDDNNRRNSERHIDNEKGHY